MNYTGSYNDNIIYGTANNNKVIVTSVDATFLQLILTVDYGTFNYIHTFEIPFFQNVAEFNFENYVHSIITQKFTEITTIDKANIKIYNFDMANVSFVLKEMQGINELSTLTKTFHMILGKITPVSIVDLDNGINVLLPTSRTLYVSKKGIITFTYLSKNNPIALIVNNTPIAINLPTENKYLHTITIPIYLISGTATWLKLSLKFAPSVILNIDDIQIIKHGIDHNLMLFQNLYGGVTIIELLGQLLQKTSLRSTHNSHVNDNITTIDVSNIEQKEEYKLNTGYLHGQDKYNMLFSLLKSFNTYFDNNSELLKIAFFNRHSLTPYQSRKYDNNETLNFKIAKNADIHYRNF